MNPLGFVITVEDSKVVRTQVIAPSDTPNGPDLHNFFKFHNFPSWKLNKLYSSPVWVKMQ